MVGKNSMRKADEIINDLQTQTVFNADDNVGRIPSYLFHEVIAALHDQELLIEDLEERIAIMAEGQDTGEEIPFCEEEIEPGVLDEEYEGW